MSCHVTHQKPDLHRTADATWDRATERDQVIRRLANQNRISSGEIAGAMAQLSLGRARVYMLITD